MALADIDAVDAEAFVAAAGTSPAQPLAVCADISDGAVVASVVERYRALRPAGLRPLGLPEHLRTLGLHVASIEED